MNGRRKAGKWSRWLQIVTVSLFLVFVIFIIYGISRMIGEVRTITIGQQELITRLALKSHKSEVPEEKKLAVEYISKKDFARFKNRNNREMNVLKKEINRLKLKIEALKNPL